VRPQIDRRYPFAEIPAAIAYFEQGHTSGRSSWARREDLPTVIGSWLTLKSAIRRRLRHGLGDVVMMERRPCDSFKRLESRLAVSLQVFGVSLTVSSASTLAGCQTAFDLDSAGVLNHDRRPPVFGWLHAAVGGGQVPRPPQAHYIFTRLGHGHG
jgi:hypothetical protein